MNRTKALSIAVALVLAVLVLFEVDFNPQFSLPGEGRQVDAEQEARYAACYAERDKEIHDVAFSTIDNPDVQKLYIKNNRDVARSDCRAQYPQRWVTVDEPFRFNLVDLKYRY
ncbi:MAG: hypothetical protein R3192_11790 [Woeseiaceae bacterium]|nr:hypothetical protein [Woeseiaceae bacterium]